jgi:hypothetical protein
MYRTVRLMCGGTLQDTIGLKSAWYLYCCSKLVCSNQTSSLVPLCMVATVSCFEIWLRDLDKGDGLSQNALTSSNEPFAYLCCSWDSMLALVVLAGSYICASMNPATGFFN